MTENATAPMLRVWAVTDASESGKIAREYVRSLVRVAAVRICPAAGPGIWPGFESLLDTPIAPTSFINVVVAGPDQWVRLIKVVAPAKLDPVVGDKLRSSWNLEAGDRTRSNGATVFEIPKQVAETISERVELWTANVRNVLFAIGCPRDQFQLASAKKYDAIVVPSARSAHLWSAIHGCKVIPIEVPVERHAAVRAAVLGLPLTPETETTKENDADSILR